MLKKTLYDQTFLLLRLHLLFEFVSYDGLYLLNGSLRPLNQTVLAPHGRVNESSDVIDL